MRFYSDITQKIYETEDDLITAENKVMEEKAAAEKAKQEREVRLSEINEAYEAYLDLVKSYEKDYNTVLYGDAGEKGVAKSKEDAKVKKTRKTAKDYFTAKDWNDLTPEEKNLANDFVEYLNDIFKF